MRSRVDKRTVRNLALAIGLPALLIALLLACPAESAPALAAALPAAGEIGPAWTSNEPVTAVVGPNGTFVADPYSVTIKFLDGALRETAVFTFTPRPDLVGEIDPPIVSTPYFFEFEGSFLSTGLSVSLWNKAKYTIQYDESKLGGVSEHTLQAYRSGDRWMPQNATLNTAANSISWETNKTGKFGIGGLGPRTYVYIPATFNSGVVRAAD